MKLKKSPYDSVNEENFARTLDLKNIPFKFEPFSIELYPKYIGLDKKEYKAITYTPDWVIKYRGKNFIIETKGFINVRTDKYLSDDYKIARHKIESKYKIPYFIVCRAGTMRDKTIDWYLFSKKNKVGKQKEVVPSLWDELDKLIEKS